MRQIIVNIGHFVWRHTPWLWLRKIFFAAFLCMVRGRRVTTTVENITFDLDLGEMIDVGILLEQFERDVVQIIDRVCKPGWMVLDVGANIGAHCLRFANAVEQDGMVYAFEPTQYAFNKLMRNLSLNSFENVKPYQLVLSNENVERGTVRCRSSWRTDGKTVNEETVVEFMRIDDWASRERVEKVDLMKVDVDGAEFNVLDGGRRLLRKCLPIVLIEVGEYHFSDMKQNPLQILSELGYRFWDTKTGYEYRTLQEMQATLRAHDPRMVVTRNVLAAIVEPKEWLDLVGAPFPQQYSE
jgi:FkbM family methyltransferase